MEDKKQLKKIILAFVVSLILASLFTKTLGGLYKDIFRPITGFAGGAHPEYIEGFIFGYLFFITLLLAIVIETKKIKILAIFTLPVLALDLVIGAFKQLVVGIALIMLGYLLGQLIVFLKSKLKKST